MNLLKVRWTVGELVSVEMDSRETVKGEMDSDCTKDELVKEEINPKFTK